MSRTQFLSARALFVVDFHQRQLHTMIQSMMAATYAGEPDSDLTDIRKFLIAAALQEFSLVRYYIEVIGLHPDDSFEDKPTALCYVALKQDKCLMQYLVMKGANVNTTDQMGMSPIHYAALGGCCYCVSYLIHSGAEINIVDSVGRTALALCKDRKDLADCFELLRRHGARFDAHALNPSCFH